jgi:CRISPR-associated protein Csy3
MTKSTQDKKQTNMVLPSVLTFTRSIEPSPAVFYAVNSQSGDSQLVEVSDHRLRATFGDYKTGFSGAKTDQELTEGNLHYVESAFLPIGYDSLKIDFSFKVLNNAMEAASSSSVDVRTLLNDFTTAYVGAGGASEIAVEYVKALVRADFLWRNKKIMENIRVSVSVNSANYVFEFPNDGSHEALYAKYKNEIKEIADAFAAALTTPYKVATVRVSAIGLVGDGQQVFPSQEFSEKEKNKPSRILAKRKVGGKQAAVFTAEKIGNALRTVDIWYQPDATYPLPVEPFGIDRSQSIAQRSKLKNSLFTLLQEKLIPLTNDLKEGKPVTGDAHFIFACFIRGGLFNGEGKPKNDEKNNKKGKAKDGVETTTEANEEADQASE